MQTVPIDFQVLDCFKHFEISRREQTLYILALSYHSYS